VRQLRVVVGSTVLVMLFLASGVQLAAQTQGEAVVVEAVSPTPVATEATTVSIDEQGADVSAITNEMVVAAFANMTGGDEAVAIMERAQAARAAAVALAPCPVVNTWLYLTPRAPTYSVQGQAGLLDLWNVDFNTGKTLTTAYTQNRAYFLGKADGWSAPANAYIGTISPWIYIDKSCLGWYVFAAKVQANWGSMTWQCGTSTFVVGSNPSVMPLLVHITVAGWYNWQYTKAGGPNDSGTFISFGTEYLGP